jgi:hypothetical protein
LTALPNLNERERELTDEIRYGYRRLRDRCDPRGHDLLAVMEQHHLEAVGHLYDLARGATDAPKLRLVEEEE